MLDNLFDLVKSHAGAAIINNTAIPNEHNDAAVGVASSSIFDTLKNAATNGNITDVMKMFSGGASNAASSPIAGLMQNSMVQNLMQKFGLNQGAASNVASSLLPEVLQNLVHKTNDPNDSSFDLQGILSKVTGGAGGFDIGSLVNNFTGNNQQQNGGGMMDSIKGLFGN